MPVLRQQSCWSLQPAWGAWGAATKLGSVQGGTVPLCSLHNRPEVSPRLEEKLSELDWRFLAMFWRLPVRAAGHSEPGFNPLLIRMIFLPLRCRIKSPGSQKSDPARP